MEKKSIIVIASVHHGNTKKIVDAIANEFGVDVVDATQMEEKDLSEYDLIGFASGQYYSKFHQAVIKFACRGYDTFGPFKLIGGIAKGHPDENDIAAAINFYKDLMIM